MNEIQNDNFEDAFEREERFTSIEPGQYWEVKKSFATSDFYKTKVSEGTVLLISDVDLVDGKAHTITIRNHPGWGSGTFKVLISDFIDRFIPCFNPEEVRNAEILAIQSKISEKQRVLHESMSNPSLLEDDIKEKLEKWEADNKPKTSSSTALVAQGNVEMTPGSLISSRANTQDVSAMVYQAKRQAEIISLHSKVVQLKAAEISRLVQSVAPYMTEQADAMVARSANAMKRVEGIMKGVQSLKLYVGEGVEVHHLLQGESASYDKKPHLMQRKLFMNEELAAFVPVEDGFDFTNISSFDKALTNKAFLDQILPHPRCVVSMAVRRFDKQYADSMESFFKNLDNKAVFLLVRDGENVYRVYSGEPSHEAASRLFPTRGEVDSIFKIWDREITFENLQYTKSLKEHELNALHYKRFMILLCGLDHRSKLLGNFYPDNEILNFMTPEFQDNYFKFVRDDDPDYVIENDIPNVFDWIKSKNKLVQSGSRVAFLTRKLINADSAPSCLKVRDDYSSGRTITDHLAKPINAFEIQGVTQNDGEFFTSAEVKRLSYRDDLARPVFTAKIKVTPDDTDYLCLDDVRSEELSRYVFNRRARISHCGYIQLFKTLINKLKEEEDFQAKTESYLLSSAKEAGVTDSLEVVRTAIRQWRCIKKGALLPEISDMKALSPILDQIHALSAGSDTMVERVKAFVAEEGIDAICLAVTGRNYVVLYAETPPEKKTTLVEDKWVDRHVLRIGKSKISIANSARFWNTGQNENKEKVIHEWKVFQINEVKEPFNITDADDFIQAINKGVEFFKSGEKLTDEQFKDIILKVKDIKVKNKSRYVVTPFVSVPVASYVDKFNDFKFIYIRAHYTDFIREFGTPEQIADVRRSYISQYESIENGQKRFDSEINFSLSSFDPSKEILISKNDFGGSLGNSRLHYSFHYDVGTRESIQEVEPEGLTKIESLFYLLEKRISEGDHGIKNPQIFFPGSNNNKKIRIFK